MRARKKGSNYEWEEIKYVQLEGSDILFKEEYLEFEQDPSSPELETYDQMGLENPLQDYWQDVRERAAIAAMQGTITILSNSDRYAFHEIVVEGFGGHEKTYPNEIAEFAVACADALVEQLKKKV